MKHLRCLLNISLVVLIVALVTACRDDDEQTIAEPAEEVPDSAQKMCSILLGDTLPELTHCTADVGS